MNILIMNVRLTNDFGGPSIAFAFCDLCRSNVSSVKIGWLTGQSSDADRKTAAKNEIEIIEVGFWFSAKNIPQVLSAINKVKRDKATYGKKRNDKVTKLISKINEYDVLVDMGGLCFTDDIPVKGVINNLLVKREWIIFKKLGKKVVLYTTALGPIRRNITHYSMRMYLKKYCDLVILRDKESEDLYLENKISTPYLLAPDSAFMFDIRERIKEDLPFEEKTVGISLSFQMKKQISNYMDIMESVCKYIIEKNANVIFIANECSGTEGSDDEFVCKEMNSKLGTNIKIYDTKNYSAEQLKSIISKCEIIIASRYHTLMASISSGVPTLALSWHPKYMDVMRMVKQESYVVEKMSFNASEIIKKFEDLYKNKEKEKQVLTQTVADAKARVIEVNKEFLKIIDA